MDEDLTTYCNSLRRLRESSSQVFSRSYCIPVDIEQQGADNADISGLKRKSETPADLENGSEKRLKEDKKQKNKKKKKDFLD
jgi:hypothetical protein